VADGTVAQRPNIERLCAKGIVARHRSLVNRMNDTSTRSAAQLASMSVECLFVRRGRNRWRLCLGNGGRITEGWSRDARYWWVDAKRLLLVGSDGRPTFELELANDSEWHGRGLRRSEAVCLMPTMPVPPAQLRRACRYRPGRSITLLGYVDYQDGLGKALLVGEVLRNAGKNIVFQPVGPANPASYPSKSFADFISRQMTDRQGVPLNSAVLAAKRCTGTKKDSRPLFCRRVLDRKPARWFRRDHPA
jgi:hypothetical protein